jgi:hypothetical protein
MGALLLPALTPLAERPRVTGLTGRDVSLSNWIHRGMKTELVFLRNNTRCLEQIITEAEAVAAQQPNGWTTREPSPLPRKRPAGSPRVRAPHFPSHSGRRL